LPVPITPKYLDDLRSEAKSQQRRGRQYFNNELTPLQLIALLDELYRLEGREHDLLQSNNHYLERARVAEAQVRVVQEGVFKRISEMVMHAASPTILVYDGVIPEDVKNKLSSNWKGLADSYYGQFKKAGS
jgi:hypothetical protein